MTISHPAKVNIRILASGIDSLYLSVSVDWGECEEFFNVLRGGQEMARADGSDYQIYLKHIDPGKTWPFIILPHGSKGYAWIISNSDFTFKIANSLKVQTRPNVFIEIRSEALWRLGPVECVSIAQTLIEVYGGCVEKLKVGRVDLCIDFVIPDELWGEDLFQYTVTRATDKGFYHSHDMLTGVRIGKGAISARLYDKPLEIKQQSKKTWMYEIWGLDEVPQASRIIRIEFQMRREVLKQLGLDLIEDLFERVSQLWAYCTREWLKFQDRPGAHHNQRKTFFWYEQIQDGFMGIQGAEPLVRERADFTERRRLLSQGYGYMISLYAKILDEHDADLSKPISIDDCLDVFFLELLTNKEHLPDIQEKVARKRAKYHRETATSVDGCPF
jgi:hypothetical protein